MNYLIHQIDRLITAMQSWNRDQADFSGKYNVASSEAIQFLRDYAGAESTFYTRANSANTFYTFENNTAFIVEGLKAYRSYIVNGLQNAISLERRAQIEVVSDILGQADTLLNDKSVHPAAPIVIIGAALEEFLRNWCEDTKLVNEAAKSSIDKYAQLLRTSELISKQDIKDIASWGGLRNEAAHGHWENVSNRDSVRYMLMGVNLFMRKYSPESRNE